MKINLDVDNVVLYQYEKIQLELPYNNNRGFAKMIKSIIYDSE
jgi:hypothetical protein